MRKKHLVLSLFVTRLMSIKVNIPVNMHYRCSLPTKLVSTIRLSKYGQLRFKNPRWRLLKWHTGGFKTVVHKTMGDFTVVALTFYFIQSVVYMYSQVRHVVFIGNIVLIQSIKSN